MTQDVTHISDSTGKPEPMPVVLNAREVIDLTARLASLLAQEVDLLADMKVAGVEALQNEKIFITNALMLKRKQIDKYPHLLETIPSQDKQDLEAIVRVFEDILAENHRKLLLAKEVNRTIVQAITDVVKEKSASNSYNEQGIKGIPAHETLSVTLNQSV